MAQTVYTTLQIIVAVGIIGFMIAVVIWVAMEAEEESTTDEKLHSPKKIISKDTPKKPGVYVFRGGEFIGNRLRFKVKIENNTEYTITDVTVFLISYPDVALRLVEDDDIRFPKIVPNGFRSPHFEFIPTQDCVRGEIIAGVSFIDAKGKAHTLSTKKYTIRAVCDLLNPENISPNDFALRLEEFEHGEVGFKVNDWTPEEMYEKTLRVIETANFHEVESFIDSSNGITSAFVAGWAIGKYTKKHVALRIDISGKGGVRGASCRIQVSGEDEALILPAIDDLKERLCAWLCPMCGSKLTIKNVQSLRKGRVVACPFCLVTIGR